MTAPDRSTKVRVVLGTAFTGAGIAHVVKHEWFEQLVPESSAQWSKPISAVTAAIQIVGGIAMFIPRWRLLGRWLNVGLLAPTLPAAIDQYNHPEVLRQAGIPRQLAPVRAVVQVLVIALTWRSTRPSTTPATVHHQHR